MRRDVRLLAVAMALATELLVEPLVPEGQVPLPAKSPGQGYDQQKDDKKGGKRHLDEAHRAARSRLVGRHASMRSDGLGGVNEARCGAS